MARLREWAQETGIDPPGGGQPGRGDPGPPEGRGQGPRSFADLIQRFSARASQVRVGVLLEELVEELELLGFFGTKGPEGDDRAENVKELIAGALDFDAELLEEEELPADRFTELDLFLQRVALVADVDLHRSGRRQRHPHDPPQCQGAGVPRGVHFGAGGWPLSPEPGL